MKTNDRSRSRSGPADEDASRRDEGVQDLRRAFSEFLTVPILVVAAFLLLAAAVSAVDHAAWDSGTWIGQTHAALSRFVFADSRGTSDLLGVIAGSLITLASITFSLLLLALQQSAASLTSEVYDQFLRRKLNQILFGFFVGAAVYSLVTLATVNPPLNPVFGAMLSLILGVIALCLLVFLIYATINQMRPSEVMRAIHGHALAARKRQLPFVRRTRRVSAYGGSVSLPVHVGSNGFIASVNLNVIAAALQDTQAEAEVVLAVSIGAYVAFDDVVAEVKARNDADATAVSEAVHKAVCLERVRDIHADPTSAVEQLAAMGWTSISTALSNPAQGTLVIYSLRDLLARWCAEDDEVAQDSVAVVYYDDLLPSTMDAFESLAVVASESMQHQNAAEIVQTFAILFERLPAEQQRRTEDLVLRLISCLGDHVLTAGLDAALSSLKDRLSACGRHTTATAIGNARQMLAASLGALNSRSTRVSPRG